MTTVKPQPVDSRHIGSNTFKWLIGTSVFLLPAAIAVVCRHLDRSEFRQNQIYKSLVAPVCIISLLLAAGVPSFLFTRTRLPLWCRIGLVSVVWGLLLAQLYWVFITVVFVP
jgi:hypothetical protein